MSDPFKNKTNSPQSLKHFYTQSTEDVNKESILLLKSNIDLLLKAFNIGGQFALFPFKVLRWQCQVHHESSRYHITPFTIIPVLFNLKHQGYSSLWKGTLSVGAFYALSSTSENILNEISPFRNKTSKVYAQILIKFITYAVTTPIYAAAIYESIQTGISNDMFGITDLLKESWNRITGYRYNYRTRLIPFWSLMLPTSFYFVGLHIASSCFERIFKRLFASLNKMFDDRRRIKCIDEIETEVVEAPYLNAIAQLSGNMAAVIALYPIETVINRLIVQGTRTIIDNTDNGVGVVPIITRYDGFFDCLRTIEHTEGFLGLYKGVGCVLIDLALSFGLLKLGKFAAYTIYDAVWISRDDKSNYEFLTQQELNRPPQ